MQIIFILVVLIMTVVLMHSFLVSSSSMFYSLGLERLISS